MKCIILIISSLFIFSCTNTLGIKTESKISAKAFQQKIVEEYQNPKTTPLRDEEVDNFVGISFFPINKKYDILADFEQITSPKEVKFPTSANKIKTFLEFGYAHFKLDNQNITLTLYGSPDKSGKITYLFLPFTDETTGITSYGGGRYLDLDLSDVNIKAKKVHLDFNKAYNPYCAYSSHWNCPIPPANNMIEVEINAGVSYPN